MVIFSRRKQNKKREEKMTGRMLFLTNKNDGAKTFLLEFTNTVFLLFMLSCLTLDAECFICLDIVQCATTYHCARPFLYDLLGAFDSIQMKGQRLLFDRKNDVEDTFLTKNMTGK